MGCPAAAAATGKTEHAVRLFLWVCGETTDAFVKRSLAVIAGAAFFDDMTLHYNDIIFFLYIHDIFNFLILVLKMFCGDSVNIIADVEAVNY